VQNLGKPNEQLFAEYLDLIASSKSAKWHYETRRLICQFAEFLAEYPRTGIDRQQENRCLMLSLNLIWAMPFKSSRMLRWRSS